jgi:UDP-GlcNAc3NAcA epimerase
MQKIVSIIGGRPQAFKVDPGLGSIIVNTGQHSDDNMFGKHLRDMKLRPKYNLGCSSDQLGLMLDKLREVLRKEQPDLVIVYGDTYSTLAGALAASLENIDIAHIEAGLRSHDKSMPEETNRVVTDHLSRWKFAPTHEAMNNLMEEGIGNGSYHVGDSLFWSLNRFLPIKRSKDYQQYIFASIHRRENLEPEVLAEIIEGLGKVEMPVYLPMHPHTARIIKKNRIKIPKNIEVVKPQPRGKTLERIQNSKLVITDSGGVQREAYWMVRHSLIIRNVTEWVEIVNRGWATLVPPIALRIAEASKAVYPHPNAPEFPSRDPYSAIKDILNS